MDTKDLENQLAAEALNVDKKSFQVFGGDKSNKTSFWSLSSFIDEDRHQRLLMLGGAILIGPVITYSLILLTHWPMQAKLSMSLVVYICSLYIFFNIYDFSFHFLSNSVLGLKPRPNYFLEFMKFFLVFITVTRLMWSFIYGPLFHQTRPANQIWTYVTAMTFSAVAAAIYHRFRQMKQITLKSKVAEAEAQYSLLESQMQPHFLFNSLNVLSELIYVDPDLANSMTQQLADLYREILTNSKAKFSTLESEISILKKYVEIQKIRFGNRIEFNVDVSPAYYNMKIPSLMLQTLVENAIKHGISPKKEGGEIKLSVRKKGGLFEVCISNTGALYNPNNQNKKSTGTGLQNTRNRLDLTYGPKSNFKIYSDDNRTYVQFLITGRTA